MNSLISAFPYVDDENTSISSRESSSEMMSETSVEDPALDATTSNPLLTYYKLVGDNIDKDVRPHNMRIDHQTQSLHYFHTYGMADRVDFSNVSDKPKSVDVNAVNLQDLLPDENDDTQLLSDFAILALRVLQRHVPFFTKFCKGVCRHIPHEFSKEMSQKSRVVSNRL